MFAKELPKPRIRRPSAPKIRWLLAAAAFAASSSHAAVTSAWTDGVSHKQSFSRVLIVGISPDLNERCPFERALASTIASATTVAIVSCDVMGLNDPLTREGIEAAVAAKNADAVLATSLISKEWGVKDGGTHETRGDAFYKATDMYYGAYGAPVVYADFQTSASITTLKGAAHITSKLYETKGATVVYSVDSKVRNIESRAAGLAEITSPIGKRLRRDGLIR